MLPGFDPDLILGLSLIGTFVFGLSGGIAGVRRHLDSSAWWCSRLRSGWPAALCATC